MRRARLIGINGIERHQAAAVGITDILGDSESEVENTFGYVLRTAIQVVGAVLIHKSFVGSSARSVVQSACDGFFGVTYRQGHDTVKVSVGLVVQFYMTGYFYDRTCCQFNALGSRHTVNTIYHHFLSGRVQL